jgi:hypothetical protein
MLINKMKNTQAPKNAKFISSLNFSSPAGRAIKYTAGAALLLVGGFYAFKLYRETEEDIKDQIEEEILSKDVYDDETLVRVYKLVIKEAYTILNKSVTAAQREKQILIKENGGMEPDGLNGIVLRKFMDSGKFYPRT